MKIRSVSMRVGMVLALIMGQVTLGTVSAHAEGAAPPALLISQFKVTTGDQFFTLYNAGTAPVNLGSYQLQYFNNNDLTRATSSKIIPLTGTLAAGSSYMLSDGAATICYQMTVNTVSLGFSTTAGFAEVVQLAATSSAGSLITPTVTDYVSWTKKTASNKDTQTITSTNSSISNLATGTPVTWLRQLPVTSPGAGAWQPTQPDPADACALDILANGGTPQGTISSANQLSTGQQPPAKIISLAASTGDGDNPVLSPADIGLAAPQLTELLPNPSGTANDDTDEFIELYNPNVAAFDLSGFTLQTGVTTKHSYQFPAGTILQPHAFTAFFSADTGLSLSNTSGQADLLDPFGNLLGKTDLYSTAKDGQTWALANGKWYWTSNATPGEANVIRQVAATSKKSKTSAKTARTSSSTTGHGTSTAVTKGGAADGPAAAPTPIHPLVLAAIGTAAVGYGIYEYRHDIANKLAELRRHRKSGRTDRLATARR